MTRTSVQRTGPSRESGPSYVISPERLLQNVLEEFHLGQQAFQAGDLPLQLFKPLCCFATLGSPAVERGFTNLQRLEDN